MLLKENKFICKFSRKEVKIDSAEVLRKKDLLTAEATLNKRLKEGRGEPHEGIPEYFVVYLIYKILYWGTELELNCLSWI